MGDLRFALRMLAKAPGFAIIAVLTLALGIGANSAIFSVIDAVLLRPLPFPKPNELIAVWSKVQGDTERETGSFPDYADIRYQSQTVENLFAFTRAGTVLGTGSDAKELFGTAVTSDIFRVLGIPPLLGRTFTRRRRKNRCACHRSDLRRWHATLIGISILSAAKFFAIAALHRDRRNAAGLSLSHRSTLRVFHAVAAARSGFSKESQFTFFALVGRLKPGANVKQASAEISAIGGRMEKQFPDSIRPHLLCDFTPPRPCRYVRPALLTIVSAVVLVLLIACANVANLLLARANQRRREIAIPPLGASRLRIVAQLLIEGVLLAILGACFGLLLAWWGIDLLRLFGPRDVPRLDDIQINAVVIVFALVAAVASTLLFAVFPALQVSRPNVNESLQEGSRGAVGPESHRARSLLIIAQVALSMLLLAGAGLLIKSFSNLRATNPGFEPSQSPDLDLALPRAKYSDLPVSNGNFSSGLMLAAPFRVSRLPGERCHCPFRVTIEPILFGSWAGRIPVPAIIPMLRISPSRGLLSSDAHSAPGRTLFRHRTAGKGCRLKSDGGTKPS